MMDFGPEPSSTRCSDCQAVVYYYVTKENPPLFCDQCRAIREEKAKRFRDTRFLVRQEGPMAFAFDAVLPGEELDKCPHCGAVVVWISADGGERILADVAWRSFFSEDGKAHRGRMRHGLFSLLDKCKSE